MSFVNSWVEHENTMKLNLGCGADFRKGYVNIDIRIPSEGSAIAEKVKRFDFKQSDVSNLLCITDNSVDEILAKDVLDHVHWKKIPDTFAEWNRVLKSGGSLYIREVPDFEQIARKYLESQRGDKEWEALQEWVERLFCPDEHMKSKNLLDPARLRKMLVDRGFIIEKEWIDAGGMNVDCRKPL